MYTYLPFSQRRYNILNISQLEIITHEDFPNLKFDGAQAFVSSIAYDVGLIGLYSQTLLPLVPKAAYTRAQHH
jgi:hypothetical protein